MADVLKFLKGMIKDTGRMDQVDGSYRDALNLVVDDLKLNVSNEYGTVDIAGLNVTIPIPGSSTRVVPIDPVGQIPLLDDTIVVFGAASPFIAGAPGTVKISTVHLVNPADHTAKLLYFTSNKDTVTGAEISTGHLNLSKTYPVTGEFRLSPLQEQIVYFTDNKSTLTTDSITGIEYVSEYNPPRVLNITKQEKSLQLTNDPKNLYGQNKTVDFLNLFTDAGRIPEFNGITILKGGGVITGAYYLGIAYADDDRTETNILTVSNPVYIVPADDDTIPRETISGAPNGTQTSKSIKWDLVNVNNQYKYLVPYIIQYSGQAKFVFKLEYVDILNTNVSVIYSGLEKVAPSSIEEAVVDKVKYLTAKSIAQLDNKLYAANLTSRPELGYQRFANNISIEPVIYEIAPFDPRRYDIYILNEGYAQLVYPDIDDAATSYPPLAGFPSNYIRGNIGTIPYIHMEGIDGVTDSYVANVIGPIQKNTSSGYRDPNLLFEKKGYRRGEVYAFYISFVLKDGSETYAYHIPGRKSVDPLELSWEELPNLGAGDGKIQSGEILTYDASALPFQYLDTSYMQSQSNMGYWQNRNEFYPITKDFETWTVNNTGEGVQVSAALPNQNIRHHKMPSNHNSSFSYVIRDTYFGQIDINEPDSTYITKAGARVFNDRVRILGIQLRNIKIPKFMLKQIQGYKVYYAKRTHGNKTIIGQSGVHPATSYLAANLVNKGENAVAGPFFNIWALDGHLKYGGLIVSDSLWTPFATPDNVINFDPRGRINYVGNPVFKFHDFTLLRKKPTIATATHIDIQYVVTMENWRGGYRGSVSYPIPGASGADQLNKYYRGFRAGVGDDTYSWVHPDLGNMINFDEPDEDSLYWDTPGPRLLWGNVYVAAKYNTPGATSIDIGTLWTNPATLEDNNLGEINKVINLSKNQSDILTNSQTVFMIEPDGATYINGLSILKSTSANSFKGSTYIHNSFGESGIVIGLASGLPMLGGYRSNEWSYVGLGNLLWSLPLYAAGTNQRLFGGFDPDFYANGNAYPQLTQDLNTWYGMMSRGHSSLRQPYPIPTPEGTLTTPITIFTATTVSGDNTITVTSGDLSNVIEGMYVSSSALPSNTFVTIVSINGNTLVLSSDAISTTTASFSVRSIGGISGTPVNDQRTRPNVYLVNLCSNKTDVFEPFDQQQLVWTGYYKSLLSVDVDSGFDGAGNNYYGETFESSSDYIFGGDTYLCRYSYRTTSTLYGLGRFARGANRSDTTSTFTDDDYIFGDIPLDLSTGITPAFGNNVFGNPDDYEVLYMGGSSTTTGGDEFEGKRRAAITNPKNWSKNGNTAFSTIYQFIVESDDNINYRHAGDPEAGVSELNSMYFDKYTAADILWRSPLGDLTKMDNLLYEDHYSALQDIRVSVPYPKESPTTPFFPNRVIRSNTQDGNFNDTYRYFLPLQYKDFGVNKGPIVNIFNLKALLYIHTERSLFRTKGKQTMELSDETQAYIGSGDLFAQEPDEFVQSSEGYIGLTNKLGSLVTKDGYIFVARKARKIFLVKDEIIDITQLGINAWARENIPFTLEAYGWDPDFIGVATDSPTDTFGFLVTYDPVFKRTIITKRELVPTALFISEFNEGLISYSLEQKKFLNSDGEGLIFKEGFGYFERGGWTISFSNSLSVWASRHSYIPPLYAYTSKNLYSFKILDGDPGDSRIFEHSDIENPCNFYNTVYNFEVDCIFTAPVNAVYSSFKYTADVFSKKNFSLPVKQQFDTGFTSFFVYNTVQVSGEVDLVYLNNIRKVDNSWSVNVFRDMSIITLNTAMANGQADVQNNLYTGTFAPTSTEPMFTSEGIINLNYIDPNKPWYEQRKFVDKFLGIRLIANNLSKNLINLYTVTVALRLSPR